MRPAADDMPERIRRSRRLLDEMETLLRRIRRTLLNRRAARADRRVAFRERTSDRRSPAAAA
jgi:hypothetical protein